MQSPYTGLSGSSCRVPRLDTAPTRCPEDPDCPDPHMQSPYTGLSGSSCAVSLHRTIRILLSSPEAGHSPSEGSGLIRTVRILICSLPTQDCPDPPVQSPYTGLSGSSCRVPRLDTAPLYSFLSHVQGCLQWSCASLGSQAGLFNHHVLSEGSGLIRTVRILICSLPTQDCPDHLHCKL